jgi:hypothetical protein
MSGHKKCKAENCVMRFDPELEGQECADNSTLTGWYIPEYVDAASKMISDNMPMHDHEI